MNHISYDGTVYKFNYLNADQIMDLTKTQQSIYYKQKEIWEHEPESVFQLFRDMALEEYKEREANV